jgi:GT2 family glycosyltransferase
MNKKKLHIAVLITIHNRKDFTLRCLESLFSQEGLNTIFIFEVFIVDDGSTDGSKDAIVSLFSQINIITTNGSLFWNRGMRYAWENAIKKNDFDFFIWLNNDTFLYNHAFSSLINIYLGSTNLSIVTGACCNSDGLFSYGLKDINGLNILPNNSYMKGYFMNGNCVLISKQVFLKIGFNDFKYTHAIGDYDYGLNAIKNGINLITTDTFIAICEKNTTIPKWKNPKISIYDRFKDFHSIKSYSKPSLLFYFNLKYFGFFRAICVIFSNYLQLLFPKT